MVMPVLKPNSSWFTPTLTTTKRNLITVINIVDSYTPSDTVADSWDASLAQDGSIMCYLDGTVLTIAGNGSGGIQANEDASWMFSDINTADFFKIATEINGLELISMTGVRLANRIFDRCQAVTSLNVGDWDMSKVQTIDTIFQYCQSMPTVDVSKWNLSSCTDISYAFNGCLSIEELDVANWDVSKVTNMRCTFQLEQKANKGRPPLKKLDVSKWNTSSCTQMDYMFYGLGHLEELDVSNFDTSKVTTFNHTFCDNYVLPSLDIRNWDVSSCDSFNAMFNDCMAIKTFDLTGWDTSNVISFSQMFEGCEALENIIGLETWNTSSGKNFGEMFRYCHSLKELNLSSFDTRNATHTYKHPSSEYGLTNIFGAEMTSLEKVTLGENWTFLGDGGCTKGYFPTPSATYIDDADGTWYTLDGVAYASSAVPNLTAGTYYAYPPSVLIDGASFNATIPDTATSVAFTRDVAPETATVTDVSLTQNGRIVAWLDGTTYYVSTQGGGRILANEDCSTMFTGKTAITSIDLGNFNTINTTNMEYMFGHTSATTALASITFGSGFNTTNVTNMFAMFRNNRAITTIDVSSFNTSSCTTMERMFDQCRALVAVDVSGFDTSKVTSLSTMFQRVPVTTVDVSKWDTSNCTDFKFMFNYCESLTTLDTSNWKTNKVTSFSSMFQGCALLNNVDVSGWNTENVTDMSFMFWNNRALTELALENWNVSKVTNFDHFLARCSALEKYDVSNWIVTSACTNLGAMFHETCVEYLDVSGWDTSNVLSFGQMFELMYNLKEIKGVNEFNTSNGINFSEMFSNCQSLKELDLSNFDTRKANGGVSISTNGGTSDGTNQMFYQTFGLEKVTLGENFTFVGDGTGGVGRLWTPNPNYINGADGNWYLIDGTAYAPASIPNLTYATYYASPIILSNVIWERDSKKYMHLAAMRHYHDLQNVEIDEKIDSLREEIPTIEEIASEDILALFAANV